MAYEYEKENIRKLNSYNVLSGGTNITKPIDELQEVYRKAKAWDSLKELLMKEYPSVVHLANVSNGEGERGEMSKHEEVLEYMDKLDGTNEFRNLLRDMEDE